MAREPIQIYVPTEWFGKDPAVELVIGSPFAPSWKLSFNRAGEITRIAATTHDGALAAEFILKPAGDDEPQ
jgi:hypothetical protein